MVYSVVEILKSPVISSKPFHLREMLWAKESNLFNDSNFDFVLADKKRLWEDDYDGFFLDVLTINIQYRYLENKSLFKFYILTIQLHKLQLLS